MPRPSTKGARRALRAVLSLLVSFLLIALSLPVSAAAAENDAEFTLEQYVTGHQDEVPTYSPGESFSFTVNVQCSSTETGVCLNAELVDELPKPLVFDEVPASITPNIATATVDGRKLTLKFKGDGLEAGQVPTVTINVKLPVNASGDFDGQTLRNSVSISADNADTVAETAVVKLDIPTKLAAKATKSASPEQTLPALPGRKASFTIGGSNESNVSVDALVLTDPATTDGTVFDYLAVTGLSSLTAPEGATRVAVDWHDGDVWHDGSPVAIPTDPDDLLPGEPERIRGLRFTFTAPDGKRLASGVSAKLTIKTVSRDNFGDLAADESLEVDNSVTALVVLGANSADDKAKAGVTFQKQPVQVALSKSFAADPLISGRSTTATIIATNGVMPVSRLEVSEPAAGHADLPAQGLSFEGFVTDPDAERQLAWPAGAQRAEITYRYTEGEPETLTTTEVDTLPGPDDSRVVSGFTVVFTAAADGIDSRARAVLPFRVAAGQVATEAGQTVTNTAGAEVASTTPDSGSDTATADLTLLPLRVRTSATKDFARSSIWATPGTTNTVHLTGRVAQSSTVGADGLQVTDADAGFWDYFDLRRVHSTDIPANAELTVSYWDGAEWQPLAGPVAGPVSDWSFTPTTTQRADLSGLRFSFTPKTEGALLPAGFTVAPRFDVALRRTLRSEPGISTTAVTATVNNTATTEVGNPVAIEPVVSSAATASVTLKSTTGGGGGGGSLWLTEKHWIDPVGGEQVDAANISALSDANRTAVLAWGTDGLSLSELQLLDDPSYDSVATSFYDAFDLVRIRPITTATDPQIGQDRVSRVELYSADAGWTDITSAACATASACDGVFPGYTLTDTERASTLAARLTFAAGSASQTGAVALSSGPDRQVRFEYQLRRTLRSEPGSYVLGSSHDHTYNSGRPGSVVNQVRATGILTEADDHGNTGVTTSDSASITILDQPLNVSMRKTLDQAQLGLPQYETTAAGDYPLVETTLVATNETASHVPQLTIADPSPKTPGLGAYDRLNLYQLQLTELPEDLAEADVVVRLTRADGTTSDHGHAEAQALTPAQLADVVGVRISYGAVANLSDPSRSLVAGGASATAVLTYQLRSHLRSEPATPVADRDVVTNTAQAEVHSPGGIGCAGAEGCDAPTADDSGSLTVVQPTYSVVAGKSINWTSRYEDQSATGYVVTLTGQPDGTARTRLLTITDDSPTFWNAFDLASVARVTVPKPINELRLSVLTGTTLEYSDGTLRHLCAGSPDLSGCWRAGDWQTADPGGQVTLTLPAGVTAGQARGVRVEARSSVDGQAVQWERPADPKLTVQLNVTRRANLIQDEDGATDTQVPTTRQGQPVAPGEATAGVTTNTMTVTGEAAWMRNTAPYTATASAGASTMLRHRVNQIKVEKTPGKGTASQAPRYDLDATIPYQLKITNTGSWQLTGLRISDRIDLVAGSSPLIPADVSPAFTVKLNGVTASGFTTALDPDTGELAIGVPDGFVLPPSGVLLVTANLRFRDQLEAGTTVTNTVTASSDRPFEKCEYTRDAQAQPALTGEVGECSASTTVVTAASTPMTVSKSVRGRGAGVPGAVEGEPNYDDLGVIAVGNADASACTAPDGNGYYAYPCTPITRPGGLETWQLTVANNGNVAANTISAIDVLPAVGDTGVVVGTSRKSKFSPTFVGNVEYTLPDAAPHRLRTFYTTTVLGASCNKSDILNDTKPSGQDTCGISWVEFTEDTSADALARARALKFLLSFDDPAEGLQPGSRFTLRFDTRTPAYAELADPSTVEPVAWNSAAVGSRTADSATFPARASLVTEPRKVGVAIASGRLDLTKHVDAPDGAAWLSLLPPQYRLGLTCTSLGEDVPLRGTSAAIDPSEFDLPADGRVVHYNGIGSVNLPLGAECTATETPAQGARISYSAAEVTAGQSYAGVANVHHGYSGGAAGELTVTNTYANAGFTVSKAVTGATALDAAGDPVRFKDFTFTAGCRFADTEVLPAGERSFSLLAGESRQFTGLPAGAECSVAESYAAGAAGTALTVTQGEAEPLAADGFELVAGEATETSVAVTNIYTTGSVLITKQLSGDGASAWAGEPFEAQLTCTSDDADPAVVYSASHTLTRDEPTWRVDDLATGADCTVTETRTGGANSTTIDGGTFTVGDDPESPAEATITNHFSTGSVRVHKLVQANGQDTSSAPWADAAYPVTLACTRNVDGVDQSIAIPGGATRQLDAAGHWAVTYSGLPTGATCSATEGVVALTPAQPEPVVAISEPVTVGDATFAAITITNDFPAGRLVIGKTLTGVGTGFFTAATFDVSCTLEGHAEPVFTRTGVRLTSAALESGQLGPIPFGASCTVTETDTGGADSTPVPQTVTIARNSATADVTEVGFSNAFSAGRVTITKTLTGEAAGESWATNATFTLAVKCGLTEAGPYSYNAAVSLKGGQSVQLKDAGGSPLLFGVGTRCWATETGTAGAVTSVVDHDSFATAAVVAADPGTVQDLTINATNSYTYAGFTVTKDVVTSGATNADGGPAGLQPDLRLHRQLHLQRRQRAQQVLQPHQAG